MIRLLLVLFLWSVSATLHATPAPLLKRSPDTPTAPLPVGVWTKPAGPLEPGAVYAIVFTAEGRFYETRDGDVIDSGAWEPRGGAYTITCDRGDRWHWTFPYHSGGKMYCNGIVYTRKGRR